MSCEEHYLNRSKKSLLWMCYGIDRNRVHFDIDNVEEDVKCPLLALKKKMCLKKDLVSELMCRHCISTKSIKKYKIYRVPRLKEYSRDHPVIHTTDT